MRQERGQTAAEYLGLLLLVAVIASSGTGSVIADGVGGAVCRIADEPCADVVANEARGEDWQRYDGGAVAFVAATLSGREPKDFLVIEGDDFEPFAYEPEAGA